MIPARALCMFSNSQSVIYFPNFWMTSLELGPSSPEEKLRLVADLVSSELQGILKQHKAAPMGEQPGQGEELEMLVVIGI